MIIYFADRQLNILGQASTELPGGLTVINDLKIEDVETGVAAFECYIPFNSKTRATVEACAEVGNYILRSHEDENEFYTIIDVEVDTKNQEVYIYCEDAGLDLLNEVVGKYEADQAYSLSFYVEKYTHDTGFVIRTNEAAGLTRKLSWDGETTVTERLASIATQFGGFEISYSFEIHGLEITGKYIHIHKKRGQDNGVQLRLNHDIDRIVVKKSIANLATALECTGGVPEDAEDPITLSGYSYDDGDFFVSGSRLYSRKAVQRWSRYSWAKEPNQLSGNVGHIVKIFSYDTTDKATLFAHALTELKKICEIEVNYEIDVKNLPDGTKIGDRVNVIDDAGEIYVSGRILKLETSAEKQSKAVTLGEYLIKGSGISSKVATLAEQFAKTSVSASRALGIANIAKTDAATAQAAAEAAQLEAETARQEVEDLANSLAEEAQAISLDAEETANDAMEVARSALLKVGEIEETVANAQEAAEGAQLAADTAQEMADSAAEAAANALADAADAKAASELAQNTATTATEKAEAAKSTADTAKAEAETAQATADAAKQDAAKAQQDIDALGEELETVSTTMSADYSRKTDLTDAAASLQSQITQNAAQIASTVSRVQTIDETANNAQEQAQAAQGVADNAKAQAEQATADAVAAQTAADEAAAAATAAQSEADTAKAAAAVAQSVADKAEADLEAAKADLATVASRVDATEEEITAAQTAVEAAQTAASAAQANAQTATEKAAEAQERAATAVSNANAAQTTANEAASNAATAQRVAEAAKGDASAALAAADEAAEIAAEAQRTANNAVTTATAAQTRADEVAQTAADAQTRAGAAKAKADQAAADLATAEQNLQAVTNRIGATEAEVEAAQAAVIAAQAAADTAHDEAEAAQATANTAKANAATAQAAANNAKAAADDAQAAADEAQQAADAAQAAVDALAVRVTTAETKITQNTEEIALMAKKSEVEQTLGGYYTKDETDAAIAIKANEITSNVSQTYTKIEDFNKLKIGGRNLLINTGAGSSGPCVVNGANYATNSVVNLSNSGGILTLDCNASANEVFYRFMSPASCSNNLYGLEAGKTYTLSGKIKVATTSGAFERVIVRTQEYKTGGWSGGISPIIATADTEGWLFFEAHYPIPANATGVYFSIQLYYKEAWKGTIQLKELKLELGNRATDWTPAPEDMATVANVDSKITQKANEITATITATMTEEIDAVSVGGRNLIANTSKAEIVLGGYPESGYTDGKGGKTIDVPTKDEYVLSFDAKSTISGDKIRCFFYSPNTTTKAVASTGYASTSVDGVVQIPLTDEWARYFVKYTQNGAATTTVKNWIIGRRLAGEGTGSISVRAIKLEEGNKATDWTPAPEDVIEDISSAQATADNAMTSISASESIIQQLANSIAALIRDGNGGSLIKQDTSGFYYFDISEIENSLNDTANSLSDLEGVVLDANGEIDVLKTTAEALRERTEYVRSYTDENGQPCLELGEGDSNFKVRITNTEIQFAEGTAIPARMNRQMLIIEKAMVRNELQFGDDQEVTGGVWVWKRRSNGNLGLAWKEVNN